jgi:magnesium chelatase family protein
MPHLLGLVAVHERTCTPAVVAPCRKRISGPLLDRIDIHVEVPRVEYERLWDDRLGEPSAAIRARVAPLHPVSPLCC